MLIGAPWLRGQGRGEIFKKGNGEKSRSPSLLVRAGVVLLRLVGVQLAPEHLYVQSAV